MNTALDSIYTYSAIVAVLSIFSIAVLIVIAPMFRMLNTGVKLFTKIRKWAFCLLFPTVVASIAATLVSLSYLKGWL